MGRGGARTAFAVVVALWCTTASAHAAFQRLDDSAAPVQVGSGQSLFSGGMVIIDGDPYIAYNVDGLDLRVARYDDATRSWVGLGGRISAGEFVTSASITNVNGRPWVAWTEDDADSVYKLRAAAWDGSAWQVNSGASTINHDITANSVSTTLSTVAGVPHVGWLEGRTDGSGTAAPRVARYDSSAGDWVELGPEVSPGRAASQPRLIDFGGQPHLIWLDRLNATDLRPVVSRWSGSSWSELAPVSPSPYLVSQPRLVAAGGTLYAGYTQEDNIVVRRMDPATGNWAQVGGFLDRTDSNAARALDLFDVGGVLTASHTEQIGGARQVIVSRLRPDGSAFDEVVGGPRPVNVDATQNAGFPLLGEVGGTPYVQWYELLAGGGSRASVARLVPEFGAASERAAAESVAFTAPISTFGFPVDVRFSYSRSPVSASVAGPVVTVTGPPADGGPVTSTARVSGLSSGTRYRWSASAGDGVRTTVSTAERSFLTAAAGSAPTETSTPAQTVPAPAVTPPFGPGSTLAAATGDGEVAGEGASAVAPERSDLDPPGQGIPSEEDPGGPGFDNAADGAGADGAEDGERSEFSRSLPRPGDLPLSLADIGRSAGIALLLLLLLTGPAMLFNETVKANREEIREWLAPVTGLLGGAMPRPARTVLGSILLAAIAATCVHVFLNPGFPDAPGSGAFALGMLAGFVALVALDRTIWHTYFSRAAPDWEGGYTVFPGQILIAAFCVLISRLAHFVPGIIIGRASSYVPEGEVPVKHAGGLVLAYAITITAVSLGVWVASIPVADAAAGAAPSFLTLTGDAAMSLVAIAGMNTMAFALAPFYFMPGYDLMRWKPKLWFAFWITGIMWLSLVVLNPALAHREDSPSVAWLVSLLAAETAICLGVWAFFAVRTKRREKMLVG